MPMSSAYVHTGNSTCQGLISQGRVFGAGKRSFSSNVAAVYPIENMTSETSVGRKQTCLPGPALPPIRYLLRHVPYVGHFISAIQPSSPSRSDKGQAVWKRSLFSKNCTQPD